MKLKAIALITLLAGATATADTNDKDLKLMVDTAYSCGLIDGAVKALLATGNKLMADAARGVDKDGVCDAVHKFVGVTKQ